MRSFISGTTTYFLFCLAMICLLASGFFVPVSHAATGGDSKTVTVPYVHIYDAEKDRTGDKFTYQVKPLDGAPVPEGSKNGVFYFTVKAVPEAVAENGNIELTMNYPEPGVYKYEVSAVVPGDSKDITYEDRTYTLNVIVSSLAKAPVITAVGPDGKKYSRLQLNPSHASKDVTVVSKPISSPDGDGGQTVTLTRPGVANPSQAPTFGQLLQNYLNDEDDVTLTDLVDQALPKANFDRKYWALLNLILLVVTIGIAFILLWRYLGRVDTDDDAYIIRREGKLRLLGLIPAVVAAVTFFRVEHFSKYIKLTDEWTVFMAVLLGVELLCAFIAYWRYDGKDGPGNRRMEGQAV